MEYLHHVMDIIVEAGILMFEYVGIVVLILSGIAAVISYARRNPMTRLLLAKGMATGLEFKLGGEILRTVVVRDFSEILLVGGIILLRAALTILIHWEIKHEEHDPEVLETMAQNRDRAYRRHIGAVDTGVGTTPEEAAESPAQAQAKEAAVHE